MLFASDYNDNRIHIHDTHSNQEYYCPYCGAPLITKKGGLRQHHFAHKQNHRCSDTWAHKRSGSGGYDLSPWHNEWQSLFPQENQEVRLVLGDTKHRADVLVDRTVIEFQHSIMPAAAFDDRNNFYFNLGYKVIWLFDLSALFSAGQITWEEKDGALTFTWNNPKKAFNCYDIQSGCIDLFFQINGNKDACIVRVTDISEFGFEQFHGTMLISQSDFLNYVGLRDGICLPPCRDDLEQNLQYQLFKKQYHINLNKQQERALQAVEGSNLLLAVPGSGKTTVLVARLGYMVLQKNIAPERILAVTYNKEAAREMKERFALQFDRSIAERIDFRTINSLSLMIYTNHYDKIDRVKKRNMENCERRRIIRDVYARIQHRYASENDIQELSTAISYIKNMMLTKEQIHQNEEDHPYLYEMYQAYESALGELCLMDFDDQMVYALRILRESQDIADAMRSRYRYISVDEAQDTSKIQHEIIRTLAQGNSLFMVGDEDQSIYGFRAAYPRALLNFRYDYKNPYILRMERNYRSTAQIVQKAQQFISQNKGRYEKNMVAERSAGDDVCVTEVPSREEQYLQLLGIARSATEETAFLYRDNESSVVLVDLLLRNQISFKLQKPEMNFFNTHIVRDIAAYFSLTVDQRDWKALDQVCGKGILHLYDKQKYHAKINCRDKGMSVFDAVVSQKEWVKPWQKDSIPVFFDVLNQLKGNTPSAAISILLESGYRRYLENKHYDLGKLEILQILAKYESTIPGFLQRLRVLENLIQQGFEGAPGNKMILSTIHSSKGQEYENVYMVDVYDGRFPSSSPNIFSRSKDSANGEQEERRLFYVGITRAKNKLSLFAIDDKQSTFIDELFPDRTAGRIQEEQDRIHRKTLPPEQSQSRHLPENEGDFRIVQVVDHSVPTTEHKKTKIKSVRSVAQILNENYDQEEYLIVDMVGFRRMKCVVCGRVQPEKDIVRRATCNKGTCRDCAAQS